jgi:hypothetical protein
MAPFSNSLTQSPMKIIKRSLTTVQNFGFEKPYFCTIKENYKIDRFAGRLTPY